MVHQVLKFESKEAFTMWEQEFREEEANLRKMGLAASPRIFTSQNEDTITIDLHWNTMEAARNYLSMHTYFSKMSTEEEIVADDVDQYISQRNYTMATQGDRLKLRREGILRLADRGVLFARDKKFYSTAPSKLMYSAEASGIKHLDSGKLFTYEEAENNVKKLSEEDRNRLLTGGVIRYFE